MSLPDFTTQDSTTYKTNIDFTAQDHETKIGERVANVGANLTTTDGGTLVGTVSSGAVTYLGVSGGTANGFPSDYGSIHTFNGSDMNRTFSIFSASAGGGWVKYIQSYDSGGVGQGWGLLTDQMTSFGNAVSAVTASGDFSYDVDTDKYSHYVSLQATGDLNFINPANMPNGSVLRFELDNAGRHTISINGTQVLDGTETDSGFYWIDCYKTYSGAEYYTWGHPQVAY